MPATIGRHEHQRHEAGRGGTGAAVSARASRPSHGPWRRNVDRRRRWRHREEAKNIVLIEIPPTFGIELLNGTP